MKILTGVPKNYIMNKVPIRADVISPGSDFYKEMREGKKNGAE